MTKKVDDPGNIWIHKIMRDIRPLIKRKVGDVKRHLSQRTLPEKDQKVNSDKCIRCDKTDNPEHTLFLWPMWESERIELIMVLGTILKKGKLIEHMVETRRSGGTPSTL